MGGGALLRASVAQQKYCGIRVQGREDVRIVTSTVEALGPCGIRVSGISERPGLHVGDDSRGVQSSEKTTTLPADLSRRA